MSKIKENYLPYLSILVALYWFVPLWTNIYAYAILGVIYEIIWLPMILLLFILPLLSVLRWKKEGHPVRSKALFSLFLNLLTLTVLLLKK